MKHEVIHTAYLHRKESRTTDVRLIRIIQEGTPWVRTFKFTYETYNSVERFYGGLFSGNKFETIFTMMDLGIEQNPSAYLLLEEPKIRKRIAEFTEKGIDFIKLLY